jgi:UDP-N-acetylmuramoyl-tripeptide--D-alanyl-D-alanine ligase
VVPNVGSAHIGEFGGLEGVAAAKGELVECLPADGVAVLNADDDRVRAMSARTSARISTFGTRETAEVRGTDLRLDQRGRPGFRLVTPEGAAPVELQFFGEHQVANALAVAAVARGLGLPVGEIAAALEAAVPVSRWRMEVRDRADGVTVLNDAYNANPESVRAALRTLVGLAGGRRTWAVLGEMRELGASSGEEHDAIGRLAVRLGIAKLVVVGEAAKPMHLGASLEGSWGDESMFVPNAEAALAVLREGVAPGDAVLVKASRAVGLERLAEALLADQPAGGPRQVSA